MPRVFFCFTGIDHLHFDPDLRAAEVYCRAPTVCFNLRGPHPRLVVERMAAAGFGIRGGHMFAPRLMDRLELAVDSGAVRASLVHYNTLDEIGRFEDALRKIVH